MVCYTIEQNEMIVEDWFGNDLVFQDYDKAVEWVEEQEDSETYTIVKNRM